MSIANGRIASEVLGINVAGHADLEILLTGFNRAYNRRRQRVLQGGSPSQKVDERIELNPALANPLYKPAAQDDLMARVDDVLYYANDVSQPDSYPEGSVGRQLFDYMDEYDLSPELNSRILADPDWKLANTIDYWNLRMGQTHDCYHILGEIGFGSVAEYFISGVVTGNAFRHLGPELAGALMTVNTLIMFPWMTRTMLHYPGAWPTLWRNLSYGNEIGQQSDMLFAAKFETITHLPPAEAREALGWRGFKGAIDSSEASLIFGEGREIIP